MKRIICCLLAALTVFGLAGCGKKAKRQLYNGKQFLPLSGTAYIFGNTVAFLKSFSPGFSMPLLRLHRNLTLLNCYAEHNNTKIY